MHYSILIYGPESVFEQLPEEERQEHLQKHRDLQEELTDKSGNSEFATVRLMPSSHAVTLRPTAGPSRKPLVVDGPFAETKERFMGFYVVECDTLDEAIELAGKIATPYGHIEVRPVSWAGGMLAR